MGAVDSRRWSLISRLLAAMPSRQGAAFVTTRQSDDARRASVARWQHDLPPHGARRASACFRPSPPGLALRRRTVQHGLCRFLHLPDAALRPLARARRLGDRRPRRRAIDPGLVPVDPYRCPDGPFWYAGRDARVRLGRDAVGTVVSAGE